MRIYEGINNFKRLKYAVVTIGTYDGVHIGHQKILCRLVEVAKMNGGESVLISFWPHPRMVLNNNSSFLKLINTMDEKQELLREIGIDHLILIPFTREFAQTSSADFVHKILVEAIGTKKLIIGYNHRFGKNREGNFESLVNDSYKYGFEVEEIPKHEIDHIGISSSIIRKSLADGDIITAEKYLGHPFLLDGLVIPGDKLGKTIGFPTANLQIEESYKLIPGDGVYAVKVKVDGIMYNGMLNIGYRPTVDGQNKKIEVHILGFFNDIYGKKIGITFVKKVRNEQKFESIQELKKQLEMDKEVILKILEKYK
jgi:riboflavin kinase/FMN adenylyltransferase